MDFAEVFTSLLFISFSSSSMSSMVLSASASLPCGVASVRPFCLKNFGRLQPPVLLEVGEVGGGGAGRLLFSLDVGGGAVPPFLGCADAELSDDVLFVMFCCAICLFCKCGGSLGAARLLLVLEAPVEVGEEGGTLGACRLL